MKTAHRTPSRFGRFGRFGRSRFKYDHEWWGEDVATVADPASYWQATRRPLPSLVFVLPLLALYEGGLSWVGGAASDAHRAGADAWARHALGLVGLTDRWLLPSVLICGLLGWQALDRRDWRFNPLVLVGMVVESLVLGIALIGLSHLVDLGFNRLEHQLLRTPGLTPGSSLPVLLGFIGAGVYEEALFRLAPIPILYKTSRLLAASGVVASTLAITLSSLLFSLAHHAGAPGETFTLFAFVFRWLAGVFFAYVYVVRGFGVAVGTHSAYDLLVGWCDIPS